MNSVESPGSRDVGNFFLDHNTSNPKECARLAAEHPAEENLLRNERILGSGHVTRSKSPFHDLGNIPPLTCSGIGLAPMKLDPLYSTRLLFHVPGTRVSHRLREAITKYSKTPPYVISSCDVQHFDLRPYLNASPILLLYTDGVADNVAGDFLFHQLSPQRFPPDLVMASLLADDMESPKAREALKFLAHPLSFGWSDNRAVELLGNILAGADAQRYAIAMDQSLLSDDFQPGKIYIDDCTLVICPLSTSP